MQVHFLITWSKTFLYESGERLIIFKWTNGMGIPREGEAINVPKFILDSYDINEKFTCENKEENIFDWIENTRGWEVEKVKWNSTNGVPFLNVAISDKPYEL